MPAPIQTNFAVPISSANHDPTPLLPGTFLPELMKPGVSPVAYLPSTCHYIENRWGEGKSTPGTVVVPIMFHSVVQPGRLINDTTSISMEYFEYFMETATELGFSTITTNELVGFLEHNQAIPERSMMLILDDRRPGVTELFMPYLEENDWTLTLGWIAADSTRDVVWETMTALASTGRLDVQSHGFNHIYIQDYITTAQIEEELFKPIEVIHARFGTRPIAHVWPGGNYDARAIALAYDAGYKVGFTVYSRGPIMFNWIPLGEPEIAMDAPLLLLPRFWSTGAVQALEEAVLVSEAAKAYANSSEEAERSYYFYYCRPYGKRVIQCGSNAHSLSG
jgi:peptidoglycan/xylan/chitin deacetylase (PgdA/CDA1 family)